MKKKLVIVESPSKAKTINKYLGTDYTVEASVGHIIDLPKTRIGVDFENNFKPQYVTIAGKKEIIKKLQEKAGKSEEVIIATDPDREGEAIAWHIENTIKEINPNIYRVEFNEITKNAVKEALKKPRKIDKNRVDSQQARRILDRIVGYQVSPFLWKSVYRGLSAGRVQSVALRLICERESEIRAFIPEEYWTLKAEFLNNHQELIPAKLEKYKGKKSHIANKEESDAHLKAIRNGTWLVHNLNKKNIQRQPAAPFITSTLQQEAVRRLRMSSKRIMAIAQSLYEGIDLGKQGQIGLITYMRTDSFRISPEAVSAVREYILSVYGKAHLPENPKFYKSKKSAQDAHEAIRPTQIHGDFHPEKLKAYLNPDQYRLYKLIWERFIACQMNPAQVEKVTLEISDNNYLFKTQGETILFNGYLSVYDDRIINEDDEENNPIPKDIKIGDKLSLEKCDSQQNFTKPVARYTESTLIKELDDKGIGRPSTYAQIISTLLERKYVESKERKLVAADLGMTVNHILIGQFPDLFNVAFTAYMEEQLDEIENNHAEYVDVLKRFYTPFETELKKANLISKEIKTKLQEQSDVLCDKCGSPMWVKWSKNGKFLACSAYPECKNTKALDAADKKEEIEISEFICEKDKGRMIFKKGPYGRYLACENYPTCKNTKPIPSNIHCPKCQEGSIISRRSKKGRIFFGCSNYPKCDFISWTEISNDACPSCGHAYMNKKVLKKGSFLVCPSCKHEISLEKEKG